MDEARARWSSASSSSLAGSATWRAWSGCTPSPAEARPARRRTCGDVRHVVRMTLGLILLAAAVVVSAGGVLRLRTVPEDVAFAVTVLASAPPSRSGSPGRSSPAPTTCSTRGASRCSACCRGGLPAFSAARRRRERAARRGDRARGQCRAPVDRARRRAQLTVLGVASASPRLLLARASPAIAAPVLRERRSRELTGLFLVALLVVVVPVGVFCIAALAGASAHPARRGRRGAQATLTGAGRWPAGTGDAGPLVVVIGTVARPAPCCGRGLSDGC